MSFQGTMHIQFKSLRVLHEGMWERVEGNRIYVFDYPQFHRRSSIGSMCLTIHSSVEVTNSIVAHKNLQCQFNPVLGFQLFLPIQLTPPCHISLLELNPWRENVSADSFLCFYLSSNGNRATTQSPFQSQLSEKLKMVFVAHIF